MARHEAACQRSESWNPLIVKITVYRLDLEQCWCLRRYDSGMGYGSWCSTISGRVSVSVCVAVRAKQFTRISAYSTGGINEKIQWLGRGLGSKLS